MPAAPTRDELAAENARLSAVLAGRDERIAALEAALAERDERITRLEALVEEVRRSGKREAAPFRKGEPKAEPNKPGRKGGDDHGRHGHRATPAKVDRELPNPFGAYLEAPEPIVELSRRHGRSLEARRCGSTRHSSTWPPTP